MVQDRILKLTKSPVDRDILNWIDKTEAAHALGNGQYAAQDRRLERDSKTVSNKTNSDYNDNDLEDDDLEFVFDADDISEYGQGEKDDSFIALDDEDDGEYEIDSYDAGSEESFAMYSPASV